MEQTAFTYHCPTRIVFGAGSLARTAPSLRADGIRRILLVTGPGPTSRSRGFAALCSSLVSEGIDFIPFAEAANDPETEVVDRGRAIFESGACEAVLAYGGGSPIDCAKGIVASAAEGRPIRDFMGTGLAFSRPAAPLYVIPTTAGSGSEVSNAAVFIKTEIDGSRKKMGVSGAGLFPRTAFVDPELHLTIPPGLTAGTGMDALTHAVEAYVSRFNTPISDLYCLGSIRLVGENLRRAVAQGASLEARSGMALAATMAGLAFSQAGLGMVHGIAHPTGALAGLAHGLANAIILPYVMRACLPDAESRLATIGGILSGKSEATGSDGVRAMALLAADTGIPRNLREAGVGEELLPAIIADALGYRRRPASPRTLSDAEIGDIVREAWGGSIA
jgi:alcohol dehydrogenase class IV